MCGGLNMALETYIDEVQTFNTKMTHKVCVNMRHSLLYNVMGSYHSGAYGVD